MIELLLQAERSLEMGSLEQAERLYWQAIDADSRNAIAIVGLAKVARRRGDDRTAIAFGRRALEVDAEDAVARRLVAELEAAHPEAGRSAKPPVGGEESPEAASRSATDLPPVPAADVPRPSEVWPASDDWTATEPAGDTRRPSRADVEWPAADLKQVRPPGDT